MLIKRGSYTKVNKGIESNEGTYFESALMAPVHSMSFSVADATATQELTVRFSHFRIIGACMIKVGAGGAGDTVSLERDRDGVTDAICTFDVATAIAGQEYLLPNDDFDMAAADFQPGDILRCEVVKGGITSPAGQIELLVAIV